MGGRPLEGVMVDGVDLSRLRHLCKPDKGGVMVIGEVIRMRPLLGPVAGVGEAG